MEQKRLKVGELAERTGVTVRTLHHYHEIGLLCPSQHSASGHRLYEANDVARLQKICSLKQLGFSLSEIHRLLDDPRCSLPRVIQLHMQALEAEIDRCQRLYQMLKLAAASMQSSDSISIEDFIRTIKETEMNEQFSKYYTKDQLAFLKERAEVVGAQRIQEVETEWPRLIAEVRAEMLSGTDPSSERMKELAARWKGLVDEFTGGNPEIERACANMYRDNPKIANQEKQVELDADVFSFVSKAMAADQ